MEADLFVTIYRQVVISLAGRQVRKQAGAGRPLFNHCRRLVGHLRMLMAAVAKTLLMHVLNAKNLCRLIGPAELAFDQRDGQDATALGAALLVLSQTVKPLHATSIRIEANGVSLRSSARNQHIDCTDSKRTRLRSFYRCAHRLPSDIRCCVIGNAFRGSILNQGNSRRL